MPDNINYEPINWKNGKAGGTALKADNLNKMDSAIESLEIGLVENRQAVEALYNQTVGRTYVYEGELVAGLNNANDLGFTSLDEIKTYDIIIWKNTKAFTSTDIHVHTGTYVLRKQCETSGDSHIVFACELIGFYNPHVDTYNASNRIITMSLEFGFNTNGTKGTLRFVEPEKHIQAKYVVYNGSQELGGSVSSALSKLEDKIKNLNASIIPFDSSRISGVPYFVYGGEKYEYFNTPAAGIPIHDGYSSFVCRYTDGSTKDVICLQISQTEMEQIIANYGTDGYRYSGRIYDTSLNVISGTAFNLIIPRAKNNVQGIIEELANEHVPFQAVYEQIQNSIPTISKERLLTYQEIQNQHVYLLDCKAHPGLSITGIVHLVPRPTYSNFHRFEVTFLGMRTDTSSDFKSPLYNIKTYTSKTDYTVSDLLSATDIVLVILHNMTDENIVGAKEANKILFDDTNFSNYYVQGTVAGAPSGKKLYIEYEERSQEDGYLAIRYYDGSVKYVTMQPLTVGHTFQSGIYDYRGPEGYVPVGGNSFIIGADYPSDNVQDAIDNLYNKIKSDNIENGTGANAIQMKQDGSSGTFDFTGKNPYATELDETLTGEIPYGATGDFATVVGGKASAQGKRSMAQGTTTIAKGNYSHAEGDNSVALGNDSHAEGYQTTASGQFAHSEGEQTLASGKGSHATGHNTIAEGEFSSAHGYYTYANQPAQYVVGKFNNLETAQQALFVVGNGEFDHARSNAFMAFKDGHAEVQTVGETDNSVITKKYLDTYSTPTQIPETWVDGATFTSSEVRNFITSHSIIQYSDGETIFELKNCMADLSGKLKGQDIAIGDDGVVTIKTVEFNFSPYKLLQGRNGYKLSIISKTKTLQ